MARVRDIVKIMEKHFPLDLASPWDNCGLMLGSPDKEVQKVLLCLDLDAAGVEEVIAHAPDLVITHHPLFFKEFKKIDYNTPLGRLIRELITHDICVYSAHTNLDAASRGVNQILAEILELDDIKPLFPEKSEKLYKLVVFVPYSHVEEVRRAVNGAGAGYIGNYSDCSFRTPGIGTFKPGEGTNPFIGEKGKVEEVEEYRLETVVPEVLLSGVIDAMLEAHPYEEVAYDVYLLQNQGQVYCMGRQGYWKEETSLMECACHVKEKLGVEKLKIAGPPDKRIRKVAVIGGAGMSLISRLPKDIDLLITGDVKYHEVKEALNWGLAVIDAGHQETEEIVLPWIRDLLTRESQASGLDVEYIYMPGKKCFWNI
ncbi:dinuclear metal center protein, YbgI/SA1388 family [Thermosyntropha lipolytica DSM 11003]|uniref:GTP cyclohydrolase 1 type 2 homolog n=1 Tax=Thermosyntropha lipolytica DSM 11003 TaxID=1123382 RepID=A0A1M5NKW5_9FIRM|nr:Nif3-like dinuclear metal center hexameric protein [Thermosyntropha lipolytica]SHG90254.1 dinuclear metal center protein, YbgI/SA1388 family [Thermosyntropha lipolytica DSM 11003]